jgi:anti-sigma regulatory factor (Ser/Thr protein kinase)
MSQQSQTFEPEPASVPVARRFVRQALHDLGADRAVDTVQTLVSELVTNAVIHARTAFTVRVDCEGSSVRVSVLDGSRAQARVRNYGTDATTGRGLRLIDSLSADWGVDRHDDGKLIWFEVPAGGDDDAADLEAWTDATDVEALLAAFDDDASGAEVRTMVRTSVSAAAGFVRGAA